MEPSLHRIFEFIVPYSASGFGLVLDSSTNRVVETSGAAAQAGIRVGDIVMAVDGQGVTGIEWTPGIDSYTVICGAPTAQKPISAAIDLVRVNNMSPAERYDVKFSVLRHEGQYSEDVQAEVLRRLETSNGTEAAAGKPAEAEVQEVSAQAPVEAAAPASLDPYLEASRQYPWATEMKLPDGEIKTKYNMVRGTVLQPISSVLPSQDAKERKKAFAGNGKFSGSVGALHGASGGAR